jgi:ferritin-like metal-binding protein YciE
MGLFSKDIKTMDDLFLHTLQDVYYAENQIVNALPKMIDKATSRELAAGLREHLRKTGARLRDSNGFSRSLARLRKAWIARPSMA